MIIAYISYSTIPSRSANSIHVMKMCHAFAVNGHKVILITPDKKLDKEQNVQNVFSFYGVKNNFKIINLPWLNFTGQRHFYALQAAVKSMKYKPDIVYSRNISGCFFASKFGFYVIFESHSPIANSGRIPERMFFDLLSKSNLKKIVVITKALKDYYENKYRQSSGKLQVAPDGADPAYETAIPVILPGKHKSIKIGYIGHLYRGRGIELIIKIADRCPWADFHIVGGKEDHIKFWKEFTKNKHNIYFHGFVSPLTAEKYRFSFDILLCPYQEKLATAAGANTVEWMSPLKVFEYMATGKPIISSSLPAICEILEHDRNAILCPPDDIDSWIHAIKRIRDNPVLGRLLGTEAKKDLLEKYTWTSRAKFVLKGT